MKKETNLHLQSVGDIVLDDVGLLGVITKIWSNGYRIYWFADEQEMQPYYGDEITRYKGYLIQQRIKWQNEQNIK